MIEIENNNRNLKNVKQIGTPREENRVYIENTTYNKIKENRQAKQVFVLMGHTEHMGSRYATFVEAAIPVSEIEFSGLVPKWNNQIWSQVFREIKRIYEDMIIVGWSLDARGIAPKMTPDLERVHREHFGGVHQLLFLLDTLEKEESFYVYKENKLISKDGFYIYHKARRKESDAVANVERGKEILPATVDVEVEIPQSTSRQVGRYRQFMQEQKEPEKDSGNMGIAVAVAMLVFVIGVGLYENSGSFFKDPPAAEVSGEEAAQIETGHTETEIETETETEAGTETAGNIIEVEVISGTE